ncbi:nuclear transport factor 2 domain-containing protein [Xylariales sp. PMI_506]|nr:nuclear transport factor 2 domain-containing protein [Xylariales sp. PMI_506]
MPLPTIETQAKVASDAAEKFVDHYYDALNRHQQLGQYYASASAKLTAAGVTPDISINGQVVGSAAELQSLLEKQGQPVVYEVQSWDAQPVNPHYVLGAVDPTVQSDKGDRLSLTVQVSGTVRYGRGEEAIVKSFNEAFVLVPHWEAQGRNAPRGLRRWLITSQNMRVA